MDACNGTANLSSQTHCPTTAAGATIFSPVIMFLAGVLGNILALIQLCRTRIDVRTTNFYSLVTGLVWTDLLGILLTSPSVIIAYVNERRWIGGETHCRFHGFTMVCFGIATAMIVCAMAVERFLAVKCVFFYSNRCKTASASNCVQSIWFIVILYGLLPLIGFGKFVTQHPGTWCYLDFHSDILLTKLYAYIYAFAFLSLTMIVCICNTYVSITIFKTRRLRRHDRHASVGTLSSACRNTDERLNGTRLVKNSDIEVQMIVFLCALTVVFTLCWTPLMVQIIITMMTGKTNRIMDLTAVRLASLNQTLDPWLYIILRRSFCSKLCSRLTRLITRCLPTRTSEHSFVDTKTRYKPVNIINIPKYENNNETREQHRDGYEFNHQIASETDVMPRLPDCNRSPLPDVTNTSSNKDRGYICRLQVGTSSSSSDKDGGIFVRIFYPRRSTCTRTDGRDTMYTSEGTTPIDRKEDVSKYPDLAGAAASTYSDNTHDLRKLFIHDRLRKTKSDS